MSLPRKLNYGMVGGGPGAFIGAVHRRAAALDGTMRLVAGAFSSDADKTKQQGAALHLDPARAYGSYQEMLEAEAQRPEGDRIDFVSIVTPNHLHFDIAKACIEAGFHVVCDKPMTTTLEDAETLCRLVGEQDVVFALTHNYSGYPIVKQARHLVRDGAIGTVRKVVVEYLQGWLSEPIEQEGNKQASWRTDPKRAGAGALGDIGTHAEQLARYITGLGLDALCADTEGVVPDRPVDDDVSMLLRYENGAKGVLQASQVAAGEENGLSIRIYGTNGGLRWRQEEPNELIQLSMDGPERIWRRGNPYLCDAAQEASRLPSGHPEAFIEAFANLYLQAGDAIARRIAGAPATDADVPTVQDGAIGVHFIQTALESGRQRSWVDARYTPPGA